MQVSPRPPYVSLSDLEAISTAPFGPTELDATTQQITELIVARLRASTAALAVLDRSGELRLAAVSTHAAVPTPAAIDTGPDSPAVRAVRTIAPVLLPAIGVSEHHTPVNRERGEFLLALPLALKQEVFGALVVSRERRFFRQDLHALRQLAHHVALGLRFARHASYSVADMQARDQQKAEFIAGVSHELRTPLHYIKGYTAALLRRDLRVTPEEIREFLEIIERESDRLGYLIEDLLDTSRIEAGVMAVDIQRMDLKGILERAVENARETALEHEIGLDLPVELPYVCGDPRRVEQVVANLLDNAIKYSPPPASVIVTATVSAGEVRVSVIDNGEGIPPEHLPHIFDRFYRASRNGARHVRGSGLGLFICRGLIEAQGGTICVESCLGEGTRISFTLPRSG